MDVGHKEKILGYYRATYIDYRTLWTGNLYRAIHFGYYDAEAKRHAAALLRLNAILADILRIGKKDVVLDAGCGYGGSSMWLAEKIGCKVTGITLVPEQVARGRRYVKERGLEEKVTILEADYDQMPFPNESFSVYWALESLVHSENRQKTFDQAYRVLQKKWSGDYSRVYTS